MKGTIRFNLRTDKLLKDGKAPIELIYSVINQRKYYNTGLKVYPEYWDRKAQRAFYIPLRDAKKLLPGVSANLLMSEVEIEEICDALLSLDKEIRDLERDFIRKGIPFSSAMIIDALKALKSPVFKKEDHKDFIYDFINQYITDNSATRVKGSLSVYKALAVHLKAFEKAFAKRISFESIDYKFFQSFQNFLIDKRNLQNTTVAKQLSTLKTFLSYARLHGVKVSDSYKDFRIKKETLEVIALTQSEFDNLYNLDLSGNKRLDQVRDVFCFSCVTGLRYSDLNQLRREHIKENEILLTVTKTKERLTIPLTDYSDSILSKYAEMHKPLPVISSQNMNAYLKEVCKLAGIYEPIEIVRYRGAKRVSEVFPKNELISVHTGRKTFVTLSLERGMSAEETMTITGHSDYKSFSRYVKITEERKKVVMLKAWNEPKSILKISG